MLESQVTLSMFATYPVLTHAVGSIQGQAQHSNSRGDINNAATLLHGSQLSSQTPERSCKVDIKNVRPLFIRSCHDRSPLLALTEYLCGSQRRLVIRHNG